MMMTMTMFTGLVMSFLLVNASPFQDGASQSNNNSNNNNGSNSNILQQIRTVLQSRANNNTFAIQRILDSSGCGQSIQSILQSSNTTTSGNNSSTSGNNSDSSGNFTIFVPTDQAFGSLSPLIRSGAFRFNCRDGVGSSCTTNPFISIATQNRGSLAAILNCIPQLLSYHIVPNNTLLFGQENRTMPASNNTIPSHGNMFANVTVLQTALNSSAFVMMNGTAQVLIVNRTDSDTFISTGYGRPVRLIGPPIIIIGDEPQQQERYNNTSANDNMSQGTIQLIDSLLIPPIPLNITLQMANLTDFAESLQTLQSSSSSSGNGTTGLTVFAPLHQQDNTSNTSSSGSTGNNTVHAGQYVIPNQVLYANSTLQSLNVTNANNETVLVESSQTGLSFGGVSVVVANIPVAEGVLHIIASTITSTSTASTTSAAATNNTTAGAFGRRVRSAVTSIV